MAGNKLNYKQLKLNQKRILTWQFYQVCNVQSGSLIAERIDPLKKLCHRVSENKHNLSTTDVSITSLKTHPSKRDKHAFSIESFAGSVLLNVHSNSVFMKGTVQYHNLSNDRSISLNIPLHRFHARCHCKHPVVDWQRKTERQPSQVTWPNMDEYYITVLDLDLHYLQR